MRTLALASLALSFAGIAQAQSVSTAGSCPGVVDVSTSGITPGGSYVILRSDGPGSATIGGGPCAGANSGLAPGFAVHGPFPADGGGNGMLAPSVPGPLDGNWISVVDVATCRVSRSVTATCRPSVPTTACSARAGATSPLRARCTATVTRSP